MVKNMTIGIDLAKNIFALIALNSQGKTMWRKQKRRAQLLKFLAQQQTCVVVMEACASAHYWARQIQQLGHQVELLPPQHIKGYLRGQKNDYNDAEGIAEASQHGRIRSIRIKSIEQQDDQAVLTVRRSLDKERTRLMNQLRGLLAEYGISIPKGVAPFRRHLPEILEDGENQLTSRFREMLARQYRRFVELDEELAWYTSQLEAQAREDEVCRRLTKVPALGEINSFALKNWMGDGKQFTRGRHASAALGIVPRQYSSGGKPNLLGITKRGDNYVRSLVIHGCRAVVAKADKKDDPLSLWIQGVKARRGYNKAVVALANKVIRMAWVIIARGESYQPRVMCQAGQA